MRLSIERRMLIGFGLVVLSVLFLTTSSFWVASIQQELNRRVIRSHQVKGHLERIRALLTVLDAQARGYAFPGSLLQQPLPTRLLTDAHVTLTALRMLTAGDSLQQLHIARLEQMVEQFGHVAHTPGGSPGVAAPGTMADRQTILRSIDASLKRMQEEEERQLQQRTDETDAFERNTQFVYLLVHLLILLSLISVYQGVRETHQRVSTTLDSIADAFFAVDSDWKISYINPRAEQLVHRDRKELLGQNVWSVFPELIGTVFETQYRHTMARRTITRFEARLPGTGAWYETAVYPSAEGISVYCRNVSDRVRAEESNRRLTGIIDATSDLIATATPDGHLLTANRALREFLGVTDEQLRYLTLRDIHTPESWEAKEKASMQAFAQGNEWSGECVYVSGNGERVPVLVKAFLHRDAGGNVIFRSNVARDIRDRKAVEEELRRVQARLKEAQRIAHLGSWEYDIASGRITWSEETFHLFGLDPTGGAPDYATLLSLHHPDDLPLLENSVRRAIEHGETYDLKLRGKAIDGQPVRWYHAVGQPVRDDSGRIVRLVGTLTDITEHKAREEAVRSSLERLNHAQRLARMGSWERNHVTGVRVWSDEMFRLHGFEITPEPPTVEQFYERVVPEDRQKIRIDLETGGSVSQEYRFRLPDGTERFMHRVYEVHRDEAGNIVRLTGTVMDVTDRKQNEEQLALVNSYLDELNRHFEIVNNQLQEQIKFVQTQQQQLSVANEQLESLATTDGLTGLRNHRSFQEVLTDEFKRAQRYGTALSLILADVDKFKLFNDSFGHPAGDSVLKTVAQALKSAARETDVVCRYGGEEFVVLLPNTDRVGALEAAERFRATLESLPWTLRPVTASFGVATVSADTTAQEELLLQADRALYSSKAGGRNRVTHFQDLTVWSETPRDSVPNAGVETLPLPLESLGQIAEQMRGQLADAYDSTILGWSRLLEIKEKETEGHSLRVADWMVRLARRVGMNEEEILFARWGALLHDVGKMGIPDQILHKPGPLTEEEWKLVRQHTTIAYRMLSPITFLRPALDIPLYHHEQWDGTGYPKGLKGEAIPLAARLFAVIDNYDALRSDRPYRRGWPREKAIEHLQSRAGTQFDPHAVAAFLQMLADEEAADDPLLDRHFPLDLTGLCVKV